MSSLFDLASLAKPLVTAPLALAFLDLEADRRWLLGFHDRETPLTVRQLLSHSSGLPPWRPFLGGSLARQLARPVPEHPLLRPATPGLATYSDLNYRLLADLLERETGLPFARLGQASGLSPAPWFNPPIELPDGPDTAAWSLATEVPPPARGLRLPHDANARAGMQGQAGFGATAPQLRAALARWVASGWPDRMAVDPVEGEGGTQWGLGLQVAFAARGRFGQLLADIPQDSGIHILESLSEEMPPAAPPPEKDRGAASGWWYHLGYTGPALFYRPADRTCMGLLLHRRGPDGALLDTDSLQARRWALLTAFVGQSRR